MFTSGTIDYLTVTAKHGTEEHAALDVIFESVKHDDVTHGLDEKPARALGYVGSKIGTMFHGANHDGAMLRVSGELAQVCANLLGWLPGNHHVTRVDFQLTWRYGHDMDDWFAILADTIRTSQTKQKVQNAPQVRHIRSFGKGDTVNVGSRTSEVFVRVYDKSREQMTETEEGLVRYEVELKGERALQAVRLWQRASSDNDLIYQVVDYWIGSRLIPRPWLPTTPLNWPEVGRPETDAERKLKWLESHVKSSVQYLLHKGHRKLVLEVLGLDEA